MWPWAEATRGVNTLLYTSRPPNKNESREEEKFLTTGGGILVIHSCLSIMNELLGLTQDSKNC